MSNSGYRPFESLKALKSRLSEKPLTEKLPPSEDDEELFERAMAKVKEIREFREIPYQSPRVTVKPALAATEREALKRLRELVDGRVPIELSKTQEYVEWINPTYKKEYLTLLQAGRLSVQDFLDLHGYSKVEAFEALRDFLKQANLKGIRCVKIIHGRGLRSVKGPVLKKALCRWLEREFRKYVVAYTTARRQDGGLGAVYVLLRI